MSNLVKSVCRRYGITKTQLATRLKVERHKFSTMCELDKFPDQIHGFLQDLQNFTGEDFEWFKNSIPKRKPRVLKFNPYRTSNKPSLETGNPEHIRAFMRRWNASVHDTGLLMGVHYSSISPWLNGKREPPQKRIDMLKDFSGITIRHFAERLLEHRGQGTVELSIPHLKPLAAPDEKEGIALVDQQEYGQAFWGYQDFYRPAFMLAMRKGEHGLARTVRHAAMDARKAMIELNAMSERPDLEEAYWKARSHAEDLLEPWMRQTGFDRLGYPLTAEEYDYEIAHPIVVTPRTEPLTDEELGEKQYEDYHAEKLIKDWKRKKTRRSKWNL